MALLLKDLAISFSSEPVPSTALQRRPLVTAQATAEALKLSLPNIGKSLEFLDDLGVIRETTGRRRNRLYAYTSYLDLLDRGTEPSPAS